MKFLFIIMSLSFALVACNKDAKTEYKQERMEANKEYRDDMKDVHKDAKKIEAERADDLEDARHDLRKEQIDESKK